MSVENPFGHQAPQQEKPKETQNPREIFLAALNEEIRALEQSGRLTTDQAKEKKEAAALIETGFSDDPKHDALIFSRAGLAEENEMIEILKKKEV